MKNCIFALLLTIVLFLGLGIHPTLAKEVTKLSSYTEEELQEGDNIAKAALEATSKGEFRQAEGYWTLLIEKFPSNPAVWSNRGSCLVSQNRLIEALKDFDQAIAIAPDAPDTYLNRGTALENLGKYDDAIADYNKVLALQPDDAMAYNNRGNANGGLGKWEEALTDYHKAIELVPNFAFARANESLALYELGRTEDALKTMRKIVRKYPMFPDARAALTAVLWQKGLQGEAESNWVAAVGMDQRYQDIGWVVNVRHWPPKMVAALDRFINLN